MAGPSSMMFLMALLTQGSGSDLLDYVQSQAYWNIQGVEVSVGSMRAQLAPVGAGDVGGLVDQLAGGDDVKRRAAAAKLRRMGAAALPAIQKAAAAAQGSPDKAAAIQNLIGQILRKPKADAVRRLVAIRTLGELKKRDALGTLRPLLKSKAQFEADYAAAAIAAIEGKTYRRADTLAKAAAKDPWLLPADCGIVGQMSIPQVGGFDFDQAVKAMGAMTGGQDPKQALQQVTTVLLEAADRVGNVRIRSVTIGVADNVGPRTGFVVLLARGIYDAKAVAAVLAEEGGGQTEKIDGVDVLRPQNEFALILPSDDLLVMVAGPTPRPDRPAATGLNDSSEAPMPARRARPMNAAVATMVAALKKKAGTLRADGDVGKLIQAADTSAPLWAVARISDAYRQGGPIIQPFETATLIGKPGEDGKTLKLTLTARASDADGAATAVAKLQEGLQEARDSIAREAARMPFLKPIADFLASIKPNRDGAVVTVTAQLEGAGATMLLPMMFVGRAVPARAVREDGEVDTPPAVEP